MMASCISCSAPLPAPSNVCTYCGRRNDVDLHGIHKYTVVKPDAERPCPRCNIPLHTINLKSDGRFFIERCDRCMGLFFDPGELDALLSESVTNVFEIDRKRLNEMNKELYQRDNEQGDTRQAFYVKCPICQGFMQRKNFGAMSGVIVDRCQRHGVWLDGGELKRLMEWKKAGGQLLHTKMAQDTSAEVTKKARSDYLSGRVNDAGAVQRPEDIWGAEGDDLMTTVFRLVERFF